MSIVIQGWFDFAEADLPAAQALMREIATATLREDGCLHYSFATDLNHPRRIQLSEWWRDDDAFDAHLDGDNITAFLRGLSQLSLAGVELKRHEVALTEDLQTQ